jgi:hypothetical protein
MKPHKLMQKDHGGGHDPHGAVAPVKKKLLEALQMAVLQEFLYMVYYYETP